MLTKCTIIIFSIPVVPIKSLLYPSFHFDRPRFFNMAYFFREVIANLKYSFGLKNIHSAYDSYVRWLKKGNQDLQLPAFKMTQQQMFWLASVHVLTEKYQRSVSPIFEIWPQLTNKYMHVILKNIREFREDFQCDNMTAREMQLLEKYQEVAGHLKKINGESCLGGIFRDGFSDEKFADFEKSGVFTFIESVMTDSEIAPDVQIFKDLRKENKWDGKNICKIFKLICYQQDCGRIFSLEEKDNGNGYFDAF